MDTVVILALCKNVGNVKINIRVFSYSLHEFEVYPLCEEHWSNFVVELESETVQNWNENTGNTKTKRNKGTRNGYDHDGYSNGLLIAEQLGGTQRASHRKREGFKKQ